MHFESQSLPAPSPLQETQDHTFPLSILPHFNTLNKTPSSKTQTHFEHFAQTVSKQGKAASNKPTLKELKRRVAELEQRVNQLQRQNTHLRRSQHQCQRCLHRRPEFYVSEATQTQMEEEADGCGSPVNRSADSIEFEHADIDLQMPLLRTAEMQGKMWIFLGLTLIAMGSRAAGGEGVVNTYKILKGATEDLGRQLQRQQKKVSLQVFCSREKMLTSSFIDGMNYDPFFAQEQYYGQGLQLDNVKLQVVNQHGLYYDNKYRYSINYEALLTIMQYAKDYCIVS